MRRPLRLSLLALLAFAAALAACKSNDAPNAASILSECPAVLSQSPEPPGAAPIASERAGGKRWSLAQVRARYVCWVSTIAPADAAKKAAGASAEERAHTAYGMRKAARLSARAMMDDAAAVEVLRGRDRDKYGDPDGPTFDWLVQHAKEKGLAGDAVYEDIVASAQRTDQAINERFGL